MASNVSLSTCIACDKKLKNIIRIHFKLHKDQDDYDCKKCKILQAKLNEEHYRVHWKQDESTSTFPCKICGTKFFEIMKNHTIETLFNSGTDHKNGDISLCSQCVQENMKVYNTFL